MFNTFVFNYSVNNNLTFMFEELTAMIVIAHLVGYVFSIFMILTGSSNVI